MKETINCKTKSSGMLILLAMFYGIVMICPGTVANKLVGIHGIIFAAGSLVLPLLFWLGCIITEVYGYEIYRKITWYAIIGQFFYTFFLFSLTKLPSPPYWHHQEAYDFVIGQLPKMFIAHFIFIPVTALINSFVISKLKILTKGKFFAVRSVGSSMVGEFVYAILICFVVFYGTLPFSQILITIGVSFFMKVFYSFFLAYPAALIARMIKTKYDIDTYDYGISYNPFKISNSVQEN